MIWSPFFITLLLETMESDHCSTAGSGDFVECVATSESE